MDANTLAILISLLVGFLGMIFSMHNMIKSATGSTNVRIDDFKKDTDRRFDEQKATMNLRFDAVDKRFEAVDKRFEAVDKRFEAVDKRFDAVDKRFDAVDKRFDAVDIRINEVKEEIHEIKSDIREMRSRLDIYIDNIALRITAGSRIARKKA